MTKPIFNHLAFLVRSVRDAAAIDELEAFPKGPAEKWEDEGTLEIYVGDEKLVGRLLLMEPIADGAYRRAMKKRGPGLHHIAIDVLDIEAYISSLSGTGWLLHPRSLETLKATRTAYLARPGIPMLIEAQERPAPSAAAKFIDRVSLPLSSEQFRIVSGLGVDGLERSLDSALSFWVGKAQVNAARLLNPE